MSHDGWPYEHPEGGHVHVDEASSLNASDSTGLLFDDLVSG